MAAFTAMAIIGGVSLAVSAYGQWKAGKAAKQAGDAQQAAAESHADLADYNAATAELQAQDALDRGAEDENRFRAGVDVMIGAQRAGIAGGNIDVGFGSALDVQADAAFLGELDALTIRTNAAREAWGFQVEADDLRRRGEIARKEGGNLAAAGREAQSAARWATAGTIIGGSSSLLQTRYGFGSSRSSAQGISTIPSRTYPGTYR